MKLSSTMSTLALAAAALVATTLTVQPDATAQLRNGIGPERAAAAVSPADFARQMIDARAAYEPDATVRCAAALDNLHAMRPFNADFMRQLVVAYASLGETSRAFNMMLRMQQQGLAEDWDSIDELEPLREYPLYEHLNALMTEAGKPFGRARQIAALDGDYPMPEALAFDAKTGRLFAGTVHDGYVLVRTGTPVDEPEEASDTSGSDSGFSVFASPDTVTGLKAVIDVLVDEQRGHLWVATGSTSQYRAARAADFGRTSLIKLDLESGEKLGEYRVLPDGKPHLLGAMTQAADGTIYATDSLSPVIYRLEPGSDRPEVFAGNPMFTSLRGLALSADEKRLYFADYDLGIFFFETDSRRGSVLRGPETLNLGGIDGLYSWQGSLVAIQNGISPNRILRLDLDESGTSVESIAPLSVALPEFDTPTFGTMVDNRLVYLAASHWDKVGENGQPFDPPLPAIPVLSSAVDEAENLVVGKEMLEQLKQQGRAVTPEG